MPSAAPTWMDSYNEYINQDGFKKQQARYGGQMDRAWNSDDGSREAKMFIDDLYLKRVNEYNTGNGTSLAPDANMLGVDAQPNDYNRTQNPKGWLNQNGINPDTLLGAAALGLGGYGLYSSGLLGGGAAAAAPASYGAEAVLSGAAPGAASLGGLTSGGIGSTIASGIGAVNKALGGNLGSIAGGLLGAAASGDTTTSTNRDPWGPAQGYLKDNLATNANMQKYYQANPFSQEQQSAYQGLLNTNANNQANAPIMQANANSFMQSNRGAMPAMQGLLSGTQAAPIDWSKYANIGKG